MKFFSTTKDVIDSLGFVIKPYPDVMFILNHVCNNKISMNIISDSKNILRVNELIKLFGWKKYFQLEKMYAGNKVEQVKK